MIEQPWLPKELYIWVKKPIQEIASLRQYSTVALRLPVVLMAVVFVVVWTLLVILAVLKTIILDASAAITAVALIRMLSLLHHVFHLTAEESTSECADDAMICLLAQPMAPDTTGNRTHEASFALSSQSKSLHACVNFTNLLAGYLGLPVLSHNRMDWLRHR